MPRVGLDVLTHFEGDQNAHKAFEMAGYTSVRDVTKCASPAEIVSQLQTTRSELMGKVQICELPPRVLDRTVQDVWQKCREASGLSAVPSDFSRKRNRDSTSTLATTGGVSTSGSDKTGTGFDAWQKLTPQKQKEHKVSFHLNGASRPLHTYIRAFLVTNNVHIILIL